MASGVYRWNRMKRLHYNDASPFYSGSLEIPNLSSYSIFFAQYSDGTRLLLFNAGAILYGGNFALGYQSPSIGMSGATYSLSGNTLTINQTRQGFTNGTTSNYGGSTVGLISLSAVI